MPIRSALVPSLLAVALLAAGCGGSSSNSGDSSSGSSSSSSNPTSSNSSGGGYGRSTSTTSSASGGAETIKTVKHTGLGTFLVDQKGKTLYLFEKDSGPKSTCYGACATNWPPVTTSGMPKAQGRVKAADLSTAKRKDGAMQVLYAGHPLYYFAPDTPGTTRGEGLDAFGAEWYVLGPAGKKVDGDEAS